MKVNRLREVLFSLIRGSCGKVLSENSHEEEELLESFLAIQAVLFAFDILSIVEAEVFHLLLILKI